MTAEALPRFQRGFQITESAAHVLEDIAHPKPRLGIEAEGIAGTGVPNCDFLLKFFAVGKVGGAAAPCAVGEQFGPQRLD